MDEYSNFCPNRILALWSESICLFEILAKGGHAYLMLVNKVMDSSGGQPNEVHSDRFLFSGIRQTPRVVPVFCQPYTSLLFR